ncbi:MAG: methylmalonyl-CoA carboxyltransferase [Betaproteobacteria bacterium RIFCSPLOWO2_02_FULL_64_12]|nr:MAG: methylmalonyl-CoA carboxyltransferase [Betaproteobacteria bacterium RIFCSPLOWO2_02_FULL_64_12]
MSDEKTWETVLTKLRAKEAEALQGGGEDRLQKQRDTGRLTARERIDYILDPNSFVELNMLSEHQCHDFGMDTKKFLGDGVITGHGTLGGRRVFLYSEDETVLGGSVGKTHGGKIHNILRLARETLVPVICLNASGGARIQEGMDNVFGITGMFYQNTLNSGVVPQISAVMGPCTGGNAYSSALCDFIVQVKKGSYLFITGPAVIKEVTGEEVSFEELGGAKAHSTVSGVVHLAAEDDRECLDLVKRLLDFLPQNNQETPPKRPGTDAADREVPELTDIVPIKPSKTYDVKKIIRAIVDKGDFFEIQRSFARNLVIGFARLGGQVAGIVANNPQFLGGCLDIDSADKAARFIRTCDAFNIPLVSLVDVPGFRPGVRQEHAGIIRHGAKMLYAWTEASVAKIAVIMRKMYGGAIPAMGVHEIGFDQVFAWPSAEMQMVGAEPAVRILYRRELDRAEDKQAFFDAKVREYQETYLTPYHSSSRSIIDAVIQPKDTRRMIISALRMLEHKTEPSRAHKKHGNIPL